MGTTAIEQALNATVLLCHVHNYRQTKLIWLAFRSPNIQTRQGTSKLAPIYIIQYTRKESFASYEWQVMMLTSPTAAIQ
jgi:hypothetical protein